MHHCQSHLASLGKAYWTDQKLLSAKIILLFLPHSDFDLLVMPEGNDGGKINVLEIRYFISACRARPSLKIKNFS